MEKRRVRLEINGVVCGLITQESDAYMRSLAEEVGDVMQEILKSSPYITREAAALTVALNYCDDAKKNGQKRQQLQDRVDELEVEAEVWHEERADMIQNGPNPETRARMENLERRNSVLQEIAGEVDELRRKVKSLEKEKAALEEQTGSPTQLEPLRREVEQLREENKRCARDRGPLRKTRSFWRSWRSWLRPTPRCSGKRRNRPLWPKRRSRSGRPLWLRPSGLWKRPRKWWTGPGRKLLPPRGSSLPRERNRNLQPRNSRMRSSRRLTGERTPCAMRMNTSRRALSVSLKRSDRAFPGGL